MRDGSAPVGVNHIAVRKLSRSFLPRVRTREGTRIENGLLPWLTDSNMSGSCQFMVVSINHATPYHGLVPSAIAITHWTNGKEGLSRLDNACACTSLHGGELAQR